MKESIKVIFSKSGRPEYIHEVHVAVCSADGQLIGEWGNPHYETYWSLAANPFRLLPLLMKGGREKFSLSDQDIGAMMVCGVKESRQIELIKSICQRIGVEFESLATSKKLDDTAMLALASLLEVDLKEYFDPSHVVQIEIKAAIARSIDFPADYVETGTENNGMPIFWSAISAMARAYAKLGNPQKAYLADDFSEALLHIKDGMRTENHSREFEELFNTELGGQIVLQSADNGVLCIAYGSKGEALALKVQDGALRVLEPVVIALCHELGWLTESDYGKLWSKYLLKQAEHSNFLFDSVDVKL